MLPKMILRQQENKGAKLTRILSGKEPYIIINSLLAGVIALIMLYSGLFSPEKNNYPVTCIHEKVTGKPCASCGLSHSMSLIIRGRTAEALEWNPNGLRIFAFFTAQFFMRIFFSFIYSNREGWRKWLVTADIMLSSLMFVWAFLPFAVYIYEFVFKS